MAAAVAAVEQGADVTVFEAARTLGGRARALPAQLPDGTPLTLDNGQHILIGAYSETLALMQRVGLDLSQAVLPLPLAHKQQLMELDNPLIRLELVGDFLAQSGIAR